MNNAKTVFLAVALACAGDFALGQESAPYQCRQACGGTEPSRYCLSAPRDEQLGTALRALRERLSNPHADRITRTELMQYFRISDDPCMRSDTVHANGAWTNKGAACIINADIEVFPGTGKVPVRIYIPDEIVFTATQQGALLTVSPRMTASHLEIRDPDLHNDWGGVVQGITATTVSAMFQLPRGCIKIPF